MPALQGGMARQLRVTTVVVLVLLGSARAGAGAVPYDQQPAGMRALYTGIAVVANVTPFVSALYAPVCLPGYLVCKVTYAGLSVVAAADQLVMSGGGDLEQTRAILHRGFGGDWYLTGRHAAGDMEPQPLAESPAPSSSGTGGTWQPPPL
jgi:hypothetical protein